MFTFINKTHLEVIPMNPKMKPFLLLRTQILSVSMVETSEKAWWSQYTTEPEVCMITTRQPDEEGKPSMMIIKNDYFTLKKSLA